MDSVYDSKNRQRSSLKRGLILLANDGPSKRINGLRARVKKSIDIAILGAVPIEVEPFLSFLSGRKRLHCYGSSFCKGMYGNATVLIGSTGLGKVNAALTTAALAERFNLSKVLNVGCAGAYREGPLNTGDVLCSRDVLCGDEGILVKEGILSSREIGIPILIRKGRACYDHIQLGGQALFRKIQKCAPAGRYRLMTSSSYAEPLLSNGMLPARTIRGTHEGSLDTKTAPSQDNHALPSENSEQDKSSFLLAYGSSVTVSMISGDTQTAGERFRRYGALAENMEGSAVAQACFRFGIPVLECRGISNVAGDRSKSHWRIETAMANCCGIVMAFLQTFCEIGGERKPDEQ